MKQLSHRVDYNTFVSTAGNVYAGLSSIGQAVKESAIEPELIELVDIRVSQINGCAFCIQHHLTQARRLGVSEMKLDLLAAWPDAGVFSPREIAALAWAEAITELARTGVREERWNSLLERFSQNEAVFLTAAIGAINNWNRIAIGLSFEPKT